MIGVGWLGLAGWLGSVALLYNSSSSSDQAPHSILHPLYHQDWVWMGMTSRHQSDAAHRPVVSPNDPQFCSSGSSGDGGGGGVVRCSLLHVSSTHCAAPCYCTGVSEPSLQLWSESPSTELPWTGRLHFTLLLDLLL